MEKKKLTGKPSVDKPWEKFYSDEVLNKELPAKTIYEYVYDNNKKYEGRVALNYFGRKITYGEMFANIDLTAKALIANGVKEGDIVSISMPTVPETVYLFYALSKLGAIANMIDPRTSKEQIEDYLNEAESKLFVIIDVASPKAKTIKKNTKVEQIIAVSPADSLPLALNLGFRAKGMIEDMKKKEKLYARSGECKLWHDFLKEGSLYKGKEVYPKYEKDKALVIVHTGGTTGNPKGVLLSNDNVNCASFQCEIAGFDFQRTQNWLNIMPPFIAYGIGNGLHLPLACGMEVIMIPQFNADKFADLLVKYKPNHMVGAPSHYGSIVSCKKLAKEDLSYIIAPTVGGDKMDEKLEAETNEFLKNHNCKYKVTKGYGMTEVNAAVAVCTSNETNELGSVGIPLPQTNISIFEPGTQNELIGYNQVGEVCITGPNTMIGYYKNEQATKEILQKHSDGLEWIHSGDLGYMNENGELYIIDRIKRMIIRADGFKVYPNIIEDAISLHPNIKECKVVGTKDFEHSQGKLPSAYIVLKDKEKENETLDEVNSLCSLKLPEYAWPHDVNVIDKFPLTPIGKVDFMALEKKSDELNQKQPSYQKRI